MTPALDKIIYPGSEQYTAADLAAPGTVPLDCGDDPIIKVDDTAYILFQVPDLQRQQAFLEDFSMQRVRADDCSALSRNMFSRSAPSKIGAESGAVGAMYSAFCIDCK